MATKRTINKTVRVQSKKLSKDDRQKFESYFECCRKCKNELFARFGGIKSLKDIQKWQKLRNQLRKSGYRKHLEETYHISNSMWVMLLMDVCANLKSAWQTTKRQIVEHMRNEDIHLTTDEKAYVYYILKAPIHWYEVLMHESVTCKTTAYQELLSKVDTTRLKYIYSFICRNTRRYKFKIPYSKQLNCISYDENMYSIEGKDGITLLKVATNFTKSKRFVCELKCTYCYRKKGNIQLIFNREKKCLEVHKLIKTKSRTIKKKDNLGVDIGYYTFLSCSDGKEYGVSLGTKITQEMERLEEYNLRRNYYASQKGDLCKKLKQIAKEVKTGTLQDSPELKREIAEIERQIAHLTENHLGNKKYKKQHKRYQATIMKDLNKAVLKMIVNSKPNNIVRENLAYSRTLRGKLKIQRQQNETEISYMQRKNKAIFNDKMTHWIQGQLEERMDYIASVYGIDVKLVNPAYTSQYCSKCYNKLTRYGEHNEKCKCLVCGEMDANINAAKNILQRANMPEITLYTKHSKVKEIIESKCQNKSS